MTQETTDNLSTCYIGIGSNLDNPVNHVEQALRELTEISGCVLSVTASSLYESEPVGPEGQENYINAVACLKCSLAPEKLLDALQSIENKHDRVRKERWGARTLDLDILLVDDLTIATERLTVPHPFMTQRNFVLVPLYELAPHLMIQNTSLKTLIEQCPNGQLDKLQNA